MPFKWRLKKTRKYDISSKNLFIVGVYLLDHTYLECTLNAESTGQECLNSIAQRVELTESHFFGLRYVTKKLHFHWVDLVKPLKKQLDKYAQQASPSHCLYFGVMFYVIGAHKVPDEVARYHYYLQLKNDIIDGRLPCSVEQAIRLAAYSLQAEFGDYEPEKYAAEDYLLFPKTMMEDEATATELLSEAIAGHQSLQGVSDARAELQYLKEVQVMDGYGAEYYSAKDESRKDLYLGTSFAGIFARYIDGQSTVYYRWPEIAKVTQAKKTLEIDTPKSSVMFQMEDTDTAKYVSRLAQLQRQFYKSSKGNLSTSLTDLSLCEEYDGQTTMDAQQVYLPPADFAQAAQELGHSQTSLKEDQRYPQDYLQSSQQSLESSSETQQQHHHHQQLFQPHHHHHQPQHHAHMAGVEGEMSGGMFQQQMLRHESVTPTPDTDPVYVNRAALLPAYRPSPDYDSVMQQRLMQQQQQPQYHHFDEIAPHLGAAQVYVHPEGMAYSQPEISQNLASYRDQHGNYANVEALRNYSHSVYANVFQDGMYNLYAGRASDRGNNLAVHPTYSSPELNTEIHQQEAFANSEYSAQEAMAFHYRPPPPPYPRTSSSTPDLAVQGGPGHMTSEPSESLLQNLMSEAGGPHSFLAQSQLDHSLDDLSGFPNLQQQHRQAQYAPNNFQQVVTTAGAEGALVQGNIGEMAVLETVAATVEGRGAGEDKVDGTNSDPQELASVPFQSSLPQSELPGTGSPSKMISDDQDDTSSEHSYSTFHAKESDDSSDEEVLRTKTLPLKEEPKIQIRMFSAQEAPPPSKIKEEATLRESFRRMKIARAGSLSKEASGKRRSLRGLKEAVEGDAHGTIVLKAVSEQPQEAAALPSESGVSPVPTVSPNMIGEGDRDHEKAASEMKEILERLGAPPPYPGKAMLPDVVSDVSENGNSSSYQPSHDSYPPTAFAANDSKENVNMVSRNVPEFKPNMSAHSGHKPQQMPVKRSSSVGNAPSRNSPLVVPPRQPPPCPKPRAATFNLDTVVPLSKPGMVMFHKDSDMGTSVLKTETESSSQKSRSEQSASMTESDGDSIKCLSASENKSGELDDGNESLTLLHDYTLGSSDSDSDHERSSTDGQFHMGPLKMAAMNGLTLSRSLVLSLMNDETRAPTDDRRRMLESKISEGQVYAEFEQIPKKMTSMECSVASSANNSHRNRFKDVLPYDLTRVKLTSSKENPDGYINASHIKLTANDNKWLFIATQAPLAHTAVDFWQMIWEGSVDVIAMLTPFQEMGKSKCFMYWPQEPGSQKKQVYGDYEVELQLTDDSLCYLTSRILLRHIPSMEEHQVWHLQYTDWPDHGCPEDTYGFLGFLDEVESVSRLAESEHVREQKSSVVVHCSAGVGRTGVVILTMVMKWCLEHNHNVDLPKALLGIRNQRMHMVQTMGQYRFIHDTLIQYLKNTRLI